MALDYNELGLKQELWELDLSRGERPLIREKRAKAGRRINGILEFVVPQ